VREVRGADVGGREAAFAVEVPRLGVEARGADLVGDLHVGPQVGQEVDGAALGGADVGGSDDAQGAAAVKVGAQRAFEDPEAVPLDEGAEQVDAIGGGDLGLKDLAEARLAVSRPAFDLFLPFNYRYAKTSDDARASLLAEHWHLAGINRDPASRTPGSPYYRQHR